MVESSFIPYTPTQTLPQGGVLVLAPHADDEVFGCGGAIIQHVAQGNPVDVIIMTDGSAAVGHPDAEQRARYIEMRQQESCQAARILGYGKPEFWGITDRTLSYSEALIERLRARIGGGAFTQVYAPSVAEIHPDHRALAMLALEAVRRCNGTAKLVQYEVGMPLHPNVLLDITRHVERKQAAMACFVSQLQIRDYGRHVLCLNGFRSYTLPAEVSAAEAYYEVESTSIQPWQIFPPSPAELQALHDKIDELEKRSEELDRVYQSFSWRITAPLRWLNAHRRKLRR